MEATDCMMDLNDAIEILESVQNWAKYESEQPDVVALAIDAELAVAINRIKTAMERIKPIAGAEMDLIDDLTNKADRASL